MQRNNGKKRDELRPVYECRPERTWRSWCLWLKRTKWFYSNSRYKGGITRRVMLTTLFNILQQYIASCQAFVKTCVCFNVHLIDCCTVCYCV